MVELLAPAGDIDAGFCALQYGADAVYLGMTQFSARAEATNFTPQNLSRFVNYAHSLKKRVLVTVNTVFFNNQIESLICVLDTLNSAKVDGVIVQDLGTVYLIQKYFPNLRIHASTQMAVHNAEGAKYLRDMGVKRVVLARELSLEEIKQITQIDGIETEVFIHGALCYSYSGICLFSAFHADRSANRGRCVYPCREKFDGSHIFSMKDLAQKENVLLLKDIGVDALKIEGRKKSALYVGAVVDYYRSLLDGEKNQSVLADKFKNIQCVFSRQTTSLYLKDPKNFDVTDPNIVGHRGLYIGNVEKLTTKGKTRFIKFKPTSSISKFDGIQIDLPNEERPIGFSAETLIVNARETFNVKAGQSVEIALPPHSQFIPEKSRVYLASTSKVKSSYPFTKPKETEFLTVQNVDVYVAIYSNKIIASSMGVCSQIDGEFSKAEHLETVQNNVEKAFSKSADSNVKALNIKLDNMGYFVPMSILNELRRDLFTKLSKVFDEEEKQRQNKICLDLQKTLNKNWGNKVDGKRIIVKTDQLELLEDLPEEIKSKVFEFIVELPNNFDGKINLPLEKIRFSIPTVIRKKDDFRKNVNYIKTTGINKFEINNIGGFEFVKSNFGLNSDIVSGWGLYAANKLAAVKLINMGIKRFTLSPETPDVDEMVQCFGDYITTINHSDYPMFISQNCPYISVNRKCLNCGGYRQKVLKSEKYGTFLSVMKNCMHYLLNEKPKIYRTESKNVQLDFMYRKWNKDDFLKILRQYL
ncbi:MAG: U32 family peptidase [Alphaproteobacteria bacterium]|nr:U32 family peptidase [Alphaproteobacteria bacterium]